LNTRVTLIIEIKGQVYPCSCQLNIDPPDTRSKNSSYHFFLAATLKLIYQTARNPDYLKDTRHNVWKHEISKVRAEESLPITRARTTRK
jgi:hypothetical protein